MLEQRCLTPYLSTCYPAEFQKDDVRVLQQALSCSEGAQGGVGSRAQQHQCHIR